MLTRGWLILLALALSGMLAGRLPADEVDRAIEQLQGVWKSSSFETNGVPKNSQTVTLTFKDDKLTMLIESPKGSMTESAKYELNLDEKPAWLDIMPMRGLVKRPVNHGIYKIEGDTLTMCHGGPDRPAKFNLRPEAVDSLIILKRVHR